MKFKITRVDKRNNNGYIIPREAMEDYLENRYDGKEIFCTLDPYQSGKDINIVDITHSIKNLKLEGDFLVADIIIIDPLISDLIKCGSKLVASYTAKVDDGEVSDIDKIRCFPSDDRAFDETP